MWWIRKKLTLLYYKIILLLYYPSQIRSRLTKIIPVSLKPTVSTSHPTSRNHQAGYWGDKKAWVLLQLIESGDNNPFPTDGNTLFNYTVTHFDSCQGVGSSGPSLPLFTHRPTNSSTGKQDRDTGYKRERSRGPTSESVPV